MSECVVASWSGVLTAILQPEEEGGYCCSIAELPGVFSQGDDIEESLENISEAAVGSLESYLWDKQPIPWREPEYPSQTMFARYLISVSAEAVPPVKEESVLSQVCGAVFTGLFFALMVLCVVFIAANMANMVYQNYRWERAYNLLQEQAKSAGLEVRQVFPAEESSAL